MIRWRDGVVVRVCRDWPGAVELEVTTAGGPLRALAYPALTGRPQPGDRVLLNGTAVELGSALAATHWLSPCPAGCPGTRPGRAMS